ncbi:3-hydroxyalkanoate synthetase [Chitiniphilus shinanonensis]|uniref:3-hydroxyalkanoate synthetase n=1 Tax=Chitiniphilus shinanonensis TaxID=553088 RepID=A0ABQ6BNB7_9NEIS|nr:DUF3141 domain-containing protein [Chitiniphilus shinanonensis]GLS02944.1 3-hydroxyalkanoate synthetase [Chitiniphilus shinanonensis]
MPTQSERLAVATTLPLKLALQWQRRVAETLHKWWEVQAPPPHALASNPIAAAWDYWTDSVERQVLFWDTLRQRGDNFLEHEKAGKPPLLHFDYELVLDARTFARPVNYALARIVPPAGVAVDERKRPYVIIDPRAGHGPGIGGFKDDSEVGMALREGHPVYFCVFFPQPMPGQRLEDVTLAEADFLREVIRRHPESPKPALVGNCQGGWAAMLVAAHAPELVGAMVMAGAPVSYWAGSDGKNPMRYAGGMLGGAWSALLAADLGGGLFDGAYLVDNFENLDPANTLVKKNHHLYDQIDTEPPRYLDFERWWGGYFLMNEEEIRWIVENLFVGNNLTEGQAIGRNEIYDLRKIRAPMVVFASLGDNITPPQQAINWVLDLYPDTDSLKASGQVIVGLAHKTTGHLGIFVSAKIARREHAQIVELLQVIETLSPGLYQLDIHDETAPDGTVRHVAELTERSVEELRGLQREQRRDELPFAAVEALSKLGVSVYTTLVRPWIAPFVTEDMAKLGRAFHPLRVQHWGWSSLNPLAKLNQHAADYVRQLRTPRDPEWRQWERYLVGQNAAALDVYRDVRDANTELAFFNLYGPAAVSGIGNDLIPDYLERQRQTTSPWNDAELLASLPHGDLLDGVLRIAVLVQRGLPSINVERRQAAYEWIAQHPALQRVSMDEVNARFQRQSLLAWRFPAEARKTLPGLFPDEAALKQAFATITEMVRSLPAAKEALANLALLQTEVLGTFEPITAAAIAEEAEVEAAFKPATAAAQPAAPAKASTSAATKPRAARTPAAKATTATAKPAAGKRAPAKEPVTKTRAGQAKQQADVAPKAKPAAARSGNGSKPATSRARTSNPNAKE